MNVIGFILRRIGWAVLVLGLLFSMVQLSPSDRGASVEAIVAGMGPTFPMALLIFAGAIAVCTVLRLLAHRIAPLPNPFTSRSL